MKITRLINGHRVELILEKIEEYERYSLYQVYKLVNGVKVPIRQECYTDFQINEIINDGYKLRGEW